MTQQSARVISPGLARRLAISSQQLAGPAEPPTREGMMSVLRDIRCLQLDPIRAVERNPLLILWSRLGNYDPSDLEALLWEDKALFEYWAHAASIVLTEDYPIFQQQMVRRASRESGWSQRTWDWLDENESLRRHILDELARRGPLAANEIEDEAQRVWESGVWSSNRYVNTMLELLWRQGLVLIAGRQGNQRLWDLAEKVLPEQTTRPPLEGREAVRQAAQHALRALGVATPAHINRHFTRSNYPDLKSVLAELEAEECILPVSVEDGDGAWPGPWYVHADRLPQLDRLAAGDWQPHTTLLSPFDNLICDRDRTEQLWDYFFRIEIYTPKAKRQYGYYVLSVLHGDRIIGRLDPKMDRKRQRLDIHAVYAEPDAPLDGETGRAVAGAVEELGRFLGAEEIAYGEQVPDGWRAALGGS